MNQVSIGVAIPTLNSEKYLERCLAPLLASALKPRILIIDSSSDDGTVVKAKSLGAEVVVIPRHEFNHGLTREKARKHLGTDIVIMVTADAIAEDQNVLEKLVQPIVEGKASIAYARQLPHDGASFFEAFPRHFNYPEVSHMRSIDDLSFYGVYTFFCSDSCAAYLNRALDEVGGFQEVLLGEDTVATAMLLRKGHHIAYQAEARVKHSHAYTLVQEFQRYYDTGIARKQYGDLLNCESSDNKQGASYVSAMIKKLAQEKPLLLPYAFAQTLAKWLGYQLGRATINSPSWIKKIFSSQKFYWK